VRTDGDTLTAEEIIAAVGDIAVEKNASSAVALKVGDYIAIVDWFVVLSAQSSRQVRTILEEIEKRLSARGATLLGKEGAEVGEWVLLDYGDVVVHIMTSECRDFYALERLWAGAPSRDLLSPSRAAAVAIESE
jgi:ribosome-associated protein